MQAHAYTGTESRLAAVAWKPNWLMIVGVNSEKAKRGPSLCDIRIGREHGRRINGTHKPMYIPT